MWKHNKHKFKQVFILTEEWKKKFFKDIQLWIALDSWAYGSPTIGPSFISRLAIHGILSIGNHIRMFIN